MRIVNRRLGAEAQWRSQQAG